MVDCRGLIGRPYVEPFGCFELVRVVLAGRGIEIPDYSESVSEDAKTDALLRYVREHADAVGDPEPGDVVLFGLGGRPAHLGVVVEPGLMIHSTEHIGAHLERFDRARWRRRVLGFWRPRG